MKVSQISLDVELADGVTSDQLIKILSKVTSAFGKIHDTDAVDVSEYYPDHTIEWCPHCETEVELPLKLGQYKCPSCGKMILNCTMCPGCQQECLALLQSETITLGAYKLYVEGQEEDQDGDNGREFTIPTEYARKLVAKYWNQTLEKFLDEYTWDQTEGWPEIAEADGMLISKQQ